MAFLPSRPIGEAPAANLCVESSFHEHFLVFQTQDGNIYMLSNFFTDNDN
jgi:hypothetical protein